ncbi:tousled-like kinase [Cordyceps javanica]|uniref:Tousled-like kinase n=1 Tax=Cordyceps javanica TaxID=43265 RepID=A0A545VLC5_9HYPO|nr:tousled-like kinase [Cordyceps javanica]TQW02531.1 tousled-like kinase [Cordyceps javanica]
MTSSTPSQDIIAWLVPASNCPAAERAVHMSENASRLIHCADADFLSSRIKTSLLAGGGGGPPRHALALTFTTQPPRRHGRFVLGTDPRHCDIVLPKLDGIAPQHCSVGFDGLSRLTLDDFSETGTQVWYDWDCAGDRRDHSWLLTSGYADDAFPSRVQCITADIQGVRFQIVANDHSSDRDAFAAKVDALCGQSEPAAAQLDALWSEPPCVSPFNALTFSALPVLRHIIVKSLGNNPDDQVYLWDMERPWEPMVKASA